MARRGRSGPRRHGAAAAGRATEGHNQMVDVAGYIALVIKNRLDMLSGAVCLCFMFCLNWLMNNGMKQCGQATGTPEKAFSECPDGFLSRCF